MTITTALLGVAGITLGGTEIYSLIFKEKRRLKYIFKQCKVMIGECTPSVLKIDENEIGKQYIISIPTGMSIHDFEKKQAEISQALKSDIEITLKNNICYIQTIKKQLKNRYDIDLNTYINTGMKFSVGKDRMENEVYLDLSGTDTHTLVVGATGSGKSVALNVLITQMILSGVELALIDLKSVEFIIFRDYKHMKQFGINQDEAYEVLEETLKEMNLRYDLLLEYRCKNYQDFNRKHPRLRIKPRVVIIDEFQTLIDDKKCKKILFQLLAKARASNIIIILSCQDPRYEVVDGKLKSNIKNYIIFKCETQVASEIATSEKGNFSATRLRGKGHGMLKSQGQYTEFQAYYLDDYVISKYIKPYNVIAKPNKEQQAIIPPTIQRSTKGKYEQIQVTNGLDLDKLQSL